MTDMWTLCFVWCVCVMSGVCVVCVFSGVVFSGMWCVYHVCVVCM